MNEDCTRAYSLNFHFINCVAEVLFEKSKILRQYVALQVTKNKIYQLLAMLAKQKRVDFKLNHVLYKMLPKKLSCANFI